MIEMEDEEDLTITRVIDASRDLVWKAWTDPDLVKRWWGPKGFTAPTIRMDVRVGGKFLGCMRSPEGKEYWSTGIYQEVVERELIVSTDSFADPEGNVVAASYYDMSAEFPLELQISVRFEEEDGKTKLTLTHGPFPASADLEGARTGWNESLDKLEEVVRSERIRRAA